MAARGDRTVEDIRIAEIRDEIEAIRRRIAAEIDGLTYKVEVPARLADGLSSAASTFTARMMQRLPGGARNATEEAAGSNTASSE
jgi:hypothetical protein